MAVLEQLAGIASSKRGMNTEQRLTKMYNSVKKQIYTNFTDNEEVYIAKQLSAFLTTVKRAQSKGLANLGANDFSKYWSMAEQAALIEQLDAISFHDGGSLLKNNLFNKTSASSYELGAFLERGVAEVVKSFYGLATNTGTEGYLKYSSIVGSAQTQIPNLVDSVDDMARETITQAYTMTSQALNQYKANDSELEKYIKYVPSVSGKIDNIGLSAELIISGEASISPMAATLIDALKDATFTDKNYISTDHLTFGQTNPFRVFATVSGEGVEAYARMLNCFINAHHPNAPAIFYRIRALYELTGFGMQYTNNMMAQLLNGKVAKYLIWNNPIGDSIKVISTKSIIQKIINHTEKMLPNGYENALFGEIQIKQSELGLL